MQCTLKELKLQQVIEQQMKSNDVQIYLHSSQMLEKISREKYAVSGRIDGLSTPSPAQPAQGSTLPLHPGNPVSNLIFFNLLYTRESMM